MPEIDPRIEAYIAQAAQFAQPILRHIRSLVHAACPVVQENLKWRFPHFLHKGILCSMAAFKNHCTFGFWKGALIFSEASVDGKLQDQAMGQFGRITCLSDLPSDKDLLGFISAAVRLNETGVRLPAKPKVRQKQILVLPDYFSSALKANKKATEAFQKFSYSHKKEYLEWLTEAKREETRQNRLATAMIWIAEGKPRYWKHVNC